MVAEVDALPLRRRTGGSASSVCVLDESSFSFCLPDFVGLAKDGVLTSSLGWTDGVG